MSCEPLLLTKLHQPSRTTHKMRHMFIGCWAKQPTGCSKYINTYSNCISLIKGSITFDHPVSHRTEAAPHTPHRLQRIFFIRWNVAHNARHIVCVCLWIHNFPLWSKLLEMHARHAQCALHRRTDTNFASCVATTVKTIGSTGETLRPSV